MLDFRLISLDHITNNQVMFTTASQARCYTNTWCNFCINIFESCYKFVYNWMQSFSTHNIINLTLIFLLPNTIYVPTIYICTSHVYIKTITMQLMIQFFLTSDCILTTQIILTICYGNNNLFASNLHYLKSFQLTLDNS